MHRNLMKHASISSQTELISSKSLCTSTPDARASYCPKAALLRRTPTAATIQHTEGADISASRNAQGSLCALIPPDGRPSRWRLRQNSTTMLWECQKKQTVCKGATAYAALEKTPRLPPVTCALLDYGLPTKARVKQKMAPTSVLQTLR